MTLDQIDIMGRPAAGFIGAGHGAHLAFTVGGKQISSDIIGKTDTMNQPVNRVLIVNGIRQTL